MGKLFLFFLFIFLSYKNIISQTIGIDIGSEFYKICLIFPGNKYRIVENLHSRIKTPNGIYMKNTDRLYENDVLDKRIKDSKSSFIFLNNYFGQKFNSSFIKNYSDFYFFDYDMEEDKDRGVINFKVKYIVNHKANETYKSIPIEVLYGSSFRYIKKISELYYFQTTNQAKSINYCFISIPSFFTYKQRLSLIQSISLSNLKLIGVTYENLGASLYYYLRNYETKNSPQYYIYFNMGSSYTQISLILYTKEEVKLINQVYDKDLGGNTFTRNLVLVIFKKINEKNNNSLKLDFKTYNKLYPYANKYKEMLSANKEIQFNIILDYKKYEDIITRDEFNQINEEFYNKIPKLMNSLFSETGNITLENITQIELIGGSIRVPEVQNVLKKYLGNEKEKLLGTHLNGDDSIAYGAAYTFKKNKILKGDGNNYNIYLEVYSLFNKSNIYKKSILFPKKTEYETSNKISLLYDNDVYVKVYEDDNLLFSYNITRVNETINQFKKEFIKNETNITMGIPKIQLSFKYTNIGLIYLNPEIIFSLDYYLTLKNEENLTNTEKDFTYTLKYIPPLTKEEKDNITSTLNNTSLNLTDEEKNYLKIKLSIGKIFPREYPSKLYFQFIDNVPKGLNSSMLHYWEKQLDSFEQFENDQEKIIEKKNMIETLLYTKKNFLEGDYGKQFGKEDELNNAKMILNEVNDWYEEEGNFITNLTLLNEKIRLLNSTFETFEKREKLYKKREIAFEKFYVLLKNLDKDYNNKLRKEKPWVEYYYEETYYNIAQKIIKYVKEKEEVQNLLKLYDDPIVKGEEIDEKREELFREYQKMENLEKPRHPERENNIKIHDTYDDNDEWSLSDWMRSFL